VLSWRFQKREFTRNTEVKGLDGTINSSAVLVRVREQDAFTVELLNPQTTAHLVNKYVGGAADCRPVV